MTDKQPTSDNTELVDQLEELTGHRSGKPLVIVRSANHKITNTVGVSKGVSAKSFQG